MAIPCETEAIVHTENVGTLASARSLVLRTEVVSGYSPNEATVL